MSERVNIYTGSSGSPHRPDDKETRSSARQRRAFCLAFLSVFLMLSLYGGEVHAQDFDGNGAVGFADFLQFAPHYGTSSGQGGYDPTFDLNSDGAINFTDYLYVVLNWERNASDISLTLPSTQGLFANARLYLDTRIETPAVNDSVLNISSPKSGESFQIQVFVPSAGGQQTSGYNLEFDDTGNAFTDNFTVTGVDFQGSTLQVNATAPILSALLISQPAIPGNGLIATLTLTAVRDVPGGTAIRLVSGHTTLADSTAANDPLDVSMAQITLFEAKISAFPSSINFGDVELTRTKDDTLTISNLSATDFLVISEISVVDTSFFRLPALALTSAMTLAAGVDTSVVVRFAPLAETAYTDTVRISSDDPLTPLLKIPLFGTGVTYPDIALSPDSLAFTMPRGASDSQVLAIGNTGADTLDYQVEIQPRAAPTALRRTPSALAQEGYYVSGMLSDEPPPASASSSTPVVKTIPANAVVIDFDDQAQPPLFTQTVALRDEYAAFGVTFEGPDALGGGAVVNEDGNFNVTGHSSPNFLAFNTGATLQDGGIPAPPETIHFAQPVSRALVYVGSGSSTASVTMEGYNQSDALVASNSVALSSTLQELSISGTGITRVVLNTTAPVFVVDDLAFVPEAPVPWLAAAPTGGSVLPGGSADITVTANTTAMPPGGFDADLTVTSNDPDEASLTVPVHLTVTGPDIAVAPDSIAFTLPPEASATQILNISNAGFDTLAFLVTPDFSTQAAALENPSRDRSGDVVRTDLSPEETDGGGGFRAAPPVGAEAVRIPFKDGFEDGDYNGWVRDGSVGIAVVTDTTAAVGNYSFHYNGGGAHRTGIHLELESGARPEHVGFWVRPGSTVLADGYFRLDAGSPGSFTEAIWFSASSSGRFYVNGDVGGNQSFVYQANMWYHVEFRNIDWTDKDFDYYVDDALIQADVPFRNAASVDSFGVVWLYNYDVSDAWWDEIQIGTAGWLSVSPPSGRVAPGGSMPVNVEVNTAGLIPGIHRAGLRVTSNDVDESPLDIPVHLTVTGPQIAVTPDSLGFDLPMGSSGTQVLTISNPGEGTLAYEIGGIAAAQQPAPAAAPQAFLLVEKGQADPRPGSPVILGSGGPDAFGYRWTDSDEPGGPAFAWEDISAQGEEVFVPTADDQSAGPFSIGFSFPYYGTDFDQFYICTNGFISFTSTSTQLSNQPLPNDGAPENLLAVFWDDLKLYNTGSGIYYHTDGNRLIVQYKDISQYGDDTSAFDFEVILHPGGAILYRYRSMDGDVSSSTVGMQNADRTDGLQVAFNNTYLHDSLTVRISPQPTWLSATPMSGTVRAGGSASVTVTANTRGLRPGVHHAPLTVMHNIPTQPPVAVPVGLTVSGAADIAVSPLDLNFGQVILGDTTSADVQVLSLGSDTLVVSSVATGLQGVFAPDTTSFSLAPGDTLWFAVRYVPSVLDVQVDTLSIFSNDPDGAVAQVQLRGQGITPPDIDIAPTAFTLQLNAGDVVERALTVSNATTAGAGDLVVKIRDRRPAPAPTATGGYPGAASKPVTRRADRPPLAQRYAGGTIYPKGGPQAGKPAALQGEPPPPGEVPPPPPPGEPFAGPFNSPLSIAFDATGNLYVGTSDGALFRVLPDGTMQPFVSSGLGFPIGMAFDADGDLFVADNSSGTVFRVTPGAAVAPFATGLGYPVGLAFNNRGDLFVADEDGVIFRVAPDGQAVPFVTEVPDVFGLAFDTNGDLLATISSTGEIARIDPAGNVSILVAPGPYLEGIAVDVDGRIYVGNGFSGTIEVYNPDGSLYRTLSTEVTGFPISLAFGPVPDGVNSPHLFAGNGSFLPTSPFANQVVRFEVGVPGLPLPPTGLPWLSESPGMLVLPAGQDSAVTLTINTQGLSDGLHEGLVILDSNDPDEPVLEVPVSLTLIGAPAISVTPDALDFGEVFVGSSTALKLKVRNVGSDVLTVSAADVSPAAFTVPSGSFTLPPLSSRELSVTFAPDAAGLQEGALTIASDDPNDAELVVPVRGVGLVAPNIALNTPALEVMLAPGGSTTGSITLSNAGVAGASDLKFNVEILYSSSAAASAGAPGSPPAPPSAQAIGAPAAFAPDEILVKFRPKTQDDYIREINRTLGTHRLRVFRRINVHQLKIDAGRSMDRVLAAYRSNAAVVYAEPNYIVRAEMVPDDPRFGELWALHNVGQDGGLEDADIDAPEAWDRANGEGVVVGVIDTGVDYLHEDLADNIWINPGEIPEDGVDNDGNGFVDDVRGWDFVNGDNDPMDDDGHGTHVAGTIAAVGNNALGVIGVAYRAKIMPLKFLDASGSGSTADAIAAVEYAVAMGAHITNNSWGGGGFSQALLDAITDADAAGVLFVAAAGNDGADNDVTPHYPSNYDVPNVISVAATDRHDELSFFSNFGARTVHLAAPGESILSTLPGNTYGIYSGTSMAAPHVSGAAALLYGLSLGSPNTPPSPGIHMAVKSQLLASVDRLESLTGKIKAGGRLNAFGALISKWLSLGVYQGAIPAGSSVTIPVRFNSKGLVPGIHLASLVFRTNDPTQGELVLPVTMDVEPTSTISGRLHYYDAPDIGVDGVDVVLSPAGVHTVSDADGTYAFPDILPGEHRIFISRVGDQRDRDAIQGSDALTILQKTAFLLPGELTADEAFAGDINGDGFVDNADALGILRYLAFFDTGIGETGLWRFHPSQIVVTSGGAVPDIQAFLMGDVQPNWGETAPPPATKVAGGVPVAVDASTAAWKGDLLTVPIQVLGNAPVGSLLLSLNYDPALFRYGSAELTGQGRGYLLVDNGQVEGQVHIALAGVPQAGGDGPIFVLTLHTRAPVEESAGGIPADRAEFTLVRLVLNDVAFPVEGGVPLVVRRIPEHFELAQNYPNPFNPQTQIRFGLPEGARVRLTVYNLLGQQVRVLVAGELEPGFHTVTWDGLTSAGVPVSSGVYIYHLQTSSGFSDAKRMLMLK